MNTCTQAYERNPDAYRLEIRAAYTDLTYLFDANMNNMMEMEEHVRLCKAFGHTSNVGDMASFRVAFNNSESVPLSVAINAWLRFRTNTMTTTETDTIDEAIKTALHEEL